jgi:hypothetical protein
MVQVKLSILIFAAAAIARVAALPVKGKELHPSIPQKKKTNSQLWVYLMIVFDFQVVMNIRNTGSGSKTGP